MIITHPLKKYSFELLIIGLLFIDLFTKSIPVLPLAFCIIAIQFIRLDLISNIVISLLFIPKFFGSLMNSIGFSGFGGYFIIFGFLLIIYALITKKLILSNYKYGFISLISLLLLFLLSAIYTTGGDYAMIKWFSTAQGGIIGFIAFCVLFSNVHKVNLNLLGLYLVLYSFFLLRISIDINQIIGPQSILDFSFLRFQSSESLGYNYSDFSISYHLPGYYALQGLALILMSHQRNRNITLIILVFLLSLVNVLYSGARQTIVIIFIIALIWSMFYFKSKFKAVFITIIVLIIFSLLFINNLDIQFLFNSTVTEGYIEGGGRGPWLLRGIDLFLNNPYFGVGFGRYSIFDTYGTYPHNIIIEILSETGLFGLLVCVIFILPFLLKNRNNEYKYLYLLLVFVFSSFVSYNLEVNIIIFSIIFTLPAIKNDY